MAITKDYEPLLLVPIGFGILVGNIPYAAGMNLGVYEEGSVLSILYQGVKQGWYPPLIFLGIGAMTDFSSMLSSPKLVLLGAAAQAGIFLTFLGAAGARLRPASRPPPSASSAAPTAPRRSSSPRTWRPTYLGAIAIAAYSYMALVPVIQPPIIHLLTTPATSA